MYYAYVLLSKKTETHYYGHTKDLLARLKSHNAGRVRYTKSKRPWILVYQESFNTKSEAFNQEIFFKSIQGHVYLRGKGLYQNNMVERFIAPVLPQRDP